MLKWCALAVAACCLVVVACSGTPPATTPTADDAATTDDGGAPAPASSPDGGITLPTGPLNDGCAPDAKSGHQIVTCKDGVVFDVEVPDVCMAGNCGAILDVHGWSMNGPMEDRHTQMRALAGPKGFVIVQPTAPGTPPSWSTDNPTGRKFDFDNTVWGFFKATLDRFVADANRIHMTGFSQGAMMTFRFMFAHGDTFASIAPISGPDGFAYPENAFATMQIVDTPPPVKIPIMYTHGTADRLLNYDRTAVPLRDQILKQYALTNEDAFKTGTGYRASRWADGTGRIMFEFWNHDFEQGNIYIGGHCVTGPSKDGDGEFLESDTPFRCIPDRDNPTIDLDTGAEILRFFTEHPKGK